MNAPFRAAEPVATARLTDYRAFIDGLRAVSILAVVLYHVGVPGISGGFVGVDVFFVISGFLIISQIVEGLERGSFSFAEFWARRALRILPPYLLVIAATMALAPFFLAMPDELKELGKEVGYASIMGVNHFFLNQQGYFDTAADSKVLLNAWSLAVEEQFYLAAPLALALMLGLPIWLGRPKLGRPILLWSSIAVFALSLAGCVLLTNAGRNYAFYVAGLRAWEFVAGGAVGFLLPMVGRLPARFGAMLADAGLVAIVASVLLYDADTAYPSWRAMVPVFGATAVILGGIASPKSAATRLLATTPMVAIGLVSYSWYLWHWPLLALARTANFGERNFAVDASLALVSLALAVATYLLIERPIRRWRQRSRRALGWRPVLAGTTLSVAVALGGWHAFTSASARAAAMLPAHGKPARVEHVPVCNLRLHAPDICNSIAAARPLGLLVGDSHAESAIRGFALFASQNGGALALLNSPGCAPMFRTTTFMADSEMAAGCARLKSDVLPIVAHGKVRPQFAVIYARWPAYTTKGYRLGPIDTPEPAADQAAAFVTGLRQTLTDLKAWGVERILVIGPTPYFDRQPANCLYIAARNGLDRRLACGMERGKVEAERRQATEHLSAALAGFDAGVRYIDPLPDFCDADRCIPFDGDTILFVDTNHLSEGGALRLAERHAAEFQWLIGGGRS